MLLIRGWRGGQKARLTPSASKCHGFNWSTSRSSEKQQVSGREVEQGEISVHLSAECILNFSAPPPSLRQSQHARSCFRAWSKSRVQAVALLIRPITTVEMVPVRGGGRGELWADARTAGTGSGFFFCGLKKRCSWGFSVTSSALSLIQVHMWTAHV